MIRLKAALLALLFFFGCAGCGFYAGPEGVRLVGGQATIQSGSGEECDTDCDDNVTVAGGQVSEGFVQMLSNVGAAAVALIFRSPQPQAAAAPAPAAGHTHPASDIVATSGE